MSTLKNIKLPGPESRIVMFKDAVFKLKYKLSSINTKEVQDSFNGRLQLVQEDIKELTATILDRAYTSDILTPVRTDLVVVFPEVLPWDQVNKLVFRHESCTLTAYPDIIFMLVHVLSSPPVTPKRRTLLGKHKLSMCSAVSTHENKGVSADTDNDISSHQKKLKTLTTEESANKEEGAYKGESSIGEADVPMEMASLDRSSSGQIGLPEETAKLTSPSATTGKTTPRSPYKQPPSIYQRFVSVVKYILGW